MTNDETTSLQQPRHLSDNMAVLAKHDGKYYTGNTTSILHAFFFISKINKANIQCSVINKKA